MVSWRVELTLKAQADLARLDRSIRRQVIDRIAWLVANFDVIQPEPLHGDWKGFYKVRAGGWRIAYSFDSTVRLITVHQIGNRDKVYKKRK